MRVGEGLTNSHMLCSMSDSLLKLPSFSSLESLPSVEDPSELLVASDILLPWNSDPFSDTFSESHG